MASLSYIIPTIGRTTLAKAVDGILEQLTPLDELFVVADGPSDVARVIMAARWSWRVFYLEIPHVGDWGGTPIDYASQLARGQYLCYLGDDDEIEPGAIEAIARTVSKTEMMPHIFAMRYYDKVMSHSTAYGEVSGQQIVAPNVKRRLPRYSAPGHSAPDHYFLTRLLKEWGEEGYEFHPEVIAKLTAMNKGKIF